MHFYVTNQTPFFKKKISKRSLCQLNTNIILKIHKIEKEP